LLSYGSFLQRSWLEATPTEDLTEAISYAILSFSKELLNDVIITWFTYNNLYALVTMKNSHNNQLYLFVATKKKHIGAKRCLRTRMTFSHSLMVPVGASKFDYVGFILLDPRFKINEICYCNLLPPQQLLPVIYVWQVQKH